MIVTCGSMTLTLGDLIWLMRHSMYSCTGCGKWGDGPHKDDCTAEEFWHREAQEQRIDRYIESLNIPQRQLGEVR